MHKASPDVGPEELMIWSEILRSINPIQPEGVTMTIEINGMAHVILTVSNFATAREFYRRLLPEFGMKVVSDNDRFFYCVGARTAIGIQPCDPTLAGERFVQQRVGLHHLCLR